jgi:hypothetical protein
MHELYRFFIQYTGSYMFRQWCAIIREVLGYIVAFVFSNFSLVLLYWIVAFAY